MAEEVERYTFTVNGETVTTTESKSLLRFLRDDLHLLSVKDGCSQGACGTCTVVIDGVATRGCVMNTKRANGKVIETVEGLSHEEQEAFV
ncbi:MAG: (2Fe-2S)-binding protein, partial [Bacteroides sp.]